MGDWRDNYAYELKESDVGKRFLKFGGQHLRLSGIMGVVLPNDVGKRLYKRGDIYQVENDEQRDRRLRCT